MPRRRRLSLRQARRIALAAQGLDRPRPAARITARHIRTVIHRLGLLQLDFVNVLIPAHQLILFSRLGAYDDDTYDRAIHRGDFVEHWAHEASIVPTASWPLLHYRRQQYQPSADSPLFKLRNYKKYLSEIIENITNNGPTSVSDLEPVAGPKRRPGDWHRSLPRRALEYHFGHGHLTVPARRANFQRVYDLPERVIHADHRDTEPSEAEARQTLLGLAAKALGIATSRDLADYYRMTTRDAAPGIAALADAGVIQPVDVEGWREPAWLTAGARLPRTLDAHALLSPFDPLVWYRPRNERLFGFHYRIEIYVPAEKRRWGYYVLPFLCGDRIAARVDLKAERRARRLQVRAAYLEPGADAEHTAHCLAAELQNVADWLNLDSIAVARRGDFAAPLAAAVRAVPRERSDNVSLQCTRR